MKTRFFPYWMAFSLLAITGISLTWWDAGDVLHSSLALVAATTGMAYTMLAGRGKISCYVFGFVNAPIYAYLSWRWGYYGDMALNLYYFAMMVPGLVLWRRNQVAQESGEIVRTHLSRCERWIWTAVMAAATAGLYGILQGVGGSRPLCDSLTNVLSVAAIVLTVKRCIEQWALWLTVDAIEIVMWWHTGAESVAILAMWALFFVDGCYCFWLWCGRSEKGRF